MIVLVIIIVLSLSVVILYKDYKHSQTVERLTNLLVDAKDQQIRQAGGTIIPSINQQTRLKVEPAPGWFDRKK